MAGKQSEKKKKPEQTKRASDHTQILYQFWNYHTWKLNVYDQYVKGSNGESRKHRRIGENVNIVTKRKCFGEKKYHHKNDECLYGFINSPHVAKKGMNEFEYMQVESS